MKTDPSTWLTVARIRGKIEGDRTVRNMNKQRSGRPETPPSGQALETSHDTKLTITTDYLKAILRVIGSILGTLN